MADADKRSEIEKLLAEAETALGAGGRPTAVSRPEAPERRTDALAERVRAALLAGAAGAGAMWLLFAFLPFLGSTSGAVAAFLATFVAVLVHRRR